MADIDRSLSNLNISMNESNDHLDSIQRNINMFTSQFGSFLAKAEDDNLAKIEQQREDAAERAERATGLNARLGNFQEGVETRLDELIENRTAGIGRVGLIGGAIAGLLGSKLLGVAALAAGLGYLISQVGDFNAEDIKKNVLTLLSIQDSFSDSTLGFFGAGGVFAATMTAIAFGLTKFSIASIFAAGSSAIVNWLEADTWAQDIVNNVATLLSISELPQIQNAGFLGTGFAGIMLELAAGLGVFSLAEVFTGASSKLIDWLNPGWAQGIVDDVSKLLTILELPAVKNSGVGGTGFAGVMTELVTGLAIFSIGKVGSSVIDGFTKVIDFFTGSKPFAERIYNEVAQLMKIFEIPVIESRSFLGTGFAGVMGEIAAGIAAFTAIKGIDALAGIGTSIIRFFTGEEGVVNQLLTLTDRSDELEKVGTSLKTIAQALSDLSFAFQGIGTVADIEFTKFARQVADMTVILPKMAYGGVAEIDGLGNDIDFGETGVLGMNLPYSQLQNRIAEISATLSPITGGSTVINNYYTGSPPTTGNMMDDLLRDFNSRQSQPSFIMAPTDNSVAVSSEQNIVDFNTSPINQRTFALQA